MIHKVTNLTLANLRSLGNHLYKVALSEDEVDYMEVGHYIESSRWVGKRYRIIKVNRRNWWVNLLEYIGITPYWSIGVIITDKCDNI